MAVQEPFPVRRPNPSQPRPENVKARTFRTSASDSYTGPGFSDRRRNTDTVSANFTGKRSVRRYGTSTPNRGEWRR